MAIPKAYQKNSYPHKKVWEESKTNRFFWLLGLFIFLYTGYKITIHLDNKASYSASFKAVKDAIQGIQFPRNMAYASSQNAAPAKPTPKAQEATPAQGSASSPSEKPTATNEKKTDQASSEDEKEDDGTKKEEVAFFDPLTITSPKEVLVFKSLGLRRQELDKREKILHQKEMEIGLLDKKIKEKVTALQEIEKKVKEQLSILDKTEIEKAEKLAKLFSTMKPKDAASIFEGLDLAIVIAIASKMSEKKLSAIFALLSPDKARQITTKISNKSSTLAKSLKESKPEETKPQG
ncbi:MAG: hypothetical protein CNLJKLNK_00936 [Holosporales bacterium]